MYSPHFSRHMRKAAPVGTGSGRTNRPLMGAGNVCQQKPKHWVHESISVVASYHYDLLANATRIRFISSMDFIGSVL